MLMKNNFKVSLNKKTFIKCFFFVAHKSLYFSTCYHRQQSVVLSMHALVSFIHFEINLTMYNLFFIFYFTEL